MSQTTISVIIPVFNERATVELLVRRVLASQIPQGTIKELIAVDDGSDDGTAQILDRLSAELPLRVSHHVRNLGKGAALRTGLAMASGDFVLFQDADLEYDPQDYRALLMPLISGGADVVYGSRFLNAKASHDVSFLSRMANRILTVFSNRITGLRITDMETGYKAFTRRVLSTLTIQEDGFGVEPEITAKIAPGVRCGALRIVEVPVAYHPRSRRAGKKIRFSDGAWAVRCVLRYSLLERSHFVARKQHSDVGDE